MPELRRDPIVGRWVIISTDRARRPLELPPQPPPQPAGVCPFCPGHEGATPREVLAYRPENSRAPNTPGWTLRVFPNRSPALMVEGDLDRRGHGLYDSMNGVGAHEVIVETPDHNRTFADLDEREIADVLSAYRERMIDLHRDFRLRYVMIFKNHGVAAGATMSHSHSQLIALPVVPRIVAEEMKGAREYYDYKERCVFCDIVRQDLEAPLADSRVVYQNDAFLVVEPYAPKFPFETWVLPRRHRSSFADCSRDEYALLGNAMRTALGKLRIALDDPPYNFMLHTAPLGEPEHPHYHWHLEIMPTLGRVAGFEWGSGFYINPTAPEEAARFLRSIELPGAAPR